MGDSGVLVVTRWRRWGRDRLYVVTSDDAKVGWWDLLTDEAHPEAPEHLPALTTAVTSWRAQRPVASAQPVREGPGTSPAPGA